MSKGRSQSAFTPFLRFLEVKREEELEGWVSGFIYYSSKSEGEIYRRFAIEVSRKGRALSDPAFSDWIDKPIRFYPNQ